MYENTVDHKVYIGQTSVGLAERAQANGRNYRECTKFWRAIQEYSWSAFKPTILMECATQDLANYYEKYFIGYYCSTDDRYGYNIQEGGQDSKIISDLGRREISRKAKERYKDRTRTPMYGKKHTPEAISKMRECKIGAKNPMYGKHLTLEHKAKLRGPRPSPNFTEELLERYREWGRHLGEMRKKRVLCIEDGTIYESATVAAKENGVGVSSMNGHLKGRQHTCHGKHFKYIDL